MKPAELGSRTSAFAPRIVDEVRELHERTVSLGRDTAGARGRRSRRERREAREAESDLLRVLGFATYDEFMAAIGDASESGDTGAVAPDPPGLSLVVPVAEIDVASVEEAVALDARQTEAALIRVLRSERHGEPARVKLDERPEDEMAALHARISVFEEEAAETRFELRRLRDEFHGSPDSLPAAPAQLETGPSDRDGTDVRHALDALVLAAAELRALGESLRAERSELTGLAAVARSEAERLLEQARADAQRIHDAAVADANALLDHARAEAVTLTRNAISTVDGLRQLAVEDRNRNTDES